MANYQKQLEGIDLLNPTEYVTTDYIMPNLLAEVEVIRNAAKAADQLEPYRTMGVDECVWSAPEGLRVKVGGKMFKVTLTAEEIE